MLPKLYLKGMLYPLNPKIKKTELDNYVAIHYILELINRKLNKEKINIHDRLLMLKSLTGTGKSTALITEVYRRFYGKKYSAFSGEVKETKLMYTTELPTDLSVFDYKDDKYTIANRNNEFEIINKKKHIILCTQPKVLTAKSKSIEIATEPYNPDLELSVNVGYTTGEFKQRVSDPKSIMYATLGSFITTMSMRTDKEICEIYDIVFIDECHIRSIDLDLSMLLIKEFLHRQAGNTAAPLFVFMSATFDVDKYADYMETPRTNGILVKGGESKYTTTFMKKPVHNYVSAAVNLVWKLHTENRDDKPEEADILVFVPDGMIGSDFQRALEKLDTKQELMIYELSGTIVKKGGDEVAKIETWSLDEVKKFEKKPNLIRRVTHSTNVAETGITITALKYVIDCGFDKSTSFSPQYGLSQLLTTPVARSAVEQRHGRVGRKFPGEAYSLYTKDTYDKLVEYYYPETYRNDISKDILNMFYSKISPEFINQPLEFEKIMKFTTACIDLEKLKLTKENFRCKNTYVNTLIENSGFVTVKDYLQSGDVFSPYPEHLLDDLPIDSFIYSRNKLLSLGLLGTYAGYLASKLPSRAVNVEGARMILSCSAYGVSTMDALSIAVLGSSKKSDYIIPDGTARFRRIPKYNINEIIKQVIPNNIIKKYYFGSIDRFINILQDDFIEGLLIFRYIASVGREFHTSKKSKKMGAKNQFKYINKKCESVGLNVKGIKEITSNRISLIKSCHELGLINNYPSCDFNSPDIINNIMRLKKCIYSGYKCNVAKFDETKGKYITSNGIPINILTNREYTANRIIYNSIFMKQAKREVYYSITADLIASMDGIL